MNKIIYMFNLKTLFLSALVILPSLQSCTHNPDAARPEDAIAEVNGKYLTRTELNNILWSGLSKEDSVKYTEQYVESWIKDALLFENARKNISDFSNIDEMTRQYRRKLIIHEYEKMMINEKLTNEIPDEELEQFLQDNKKMFMLKKPVLRGLYLKIPVDAPQLKELKKWVKKMEPETLEKIEKYSLQNAIVFDYFFDHWVEFDELMENIPYRITDYNGFLRTNKYLELTEGDYWYFVFIDQYQQSGTIQPFEYARPRLLELVINKNKNTFFRSVENQLYEEAKQKNEIKFYGIEPSGSELKN